MEPLPKVEDLIPRLRRHGIELPTHRSRAKRSYAGDVLIIRGAECRASVPSGLARPLAIIEDPRIRSI